MGLDHHVAHHHVHRCISGRDSIAIPSIGWGVLLVLHAGAKQLGSSRFLGRRVVVGSRECHRHIDSQFWVRETSFPLNFTTS